MAGCQPSLRFGVCDGFGLCDPLDRLAGSTIPYQDRGIVARLEELADVFRSGEGARCEGGVDAHGCSCLATNTEPWSNKSASGSYPLMKRTSEMYLRPGRRS